MADDLKREFASYAAEELGLPEPGIASTDDFTGRELLGMQSLTEFIKNVPNAPAELKQLVHPREMLAGLHSIIIVAVPNYMSGPMHREQCREDLRGALSPVHLSALLQQHIDDVRESVVAFFESRGHACRPLPPNAPLKIFAARSGIGYYGKNSMIITKKYGSWISLLGFATGARLEPDDPAPGGCAECSLCVQACPAAALDRPYACAMQACVNFQLQNKNSIPEAARPLLKHGLAYGACRACRDVCPHNRHLAPLADPDINAGTMNPGLLAVLDLDDARWDQQYRQTRMGAIMMHRRYVIRNALIALGNYADCRSVARIGRELQNDDLLVREYAAWALGCIGGAEALSFLEEALTRETDPEVRRAIKKALARQGRRLKIGSRDRGAS